MRWDPIKKLERETQEFEAAQARVNQAKEKQALAVAWLDSHPATDPLYAKAQQRKEFWERELREAEKELNNWEKAFPHLLAAADQAEDQIKADSAKQAESSGAQPSTNCWVCGQPVYDYPPVIEPGWYVHPACAGEVAEQA